LIAYLQAHLKDQSKYPLKCYLNGCHTPIDYNDVSRVLTTEELSIYDKFLVRVAFISDTVTQPLYCPLPDCNTMMIVDSNDLQEPLKLCTGCHRQFCCKCLTEWHTGKTCEQQKLADGGEGEALRAANLAKFHELAKKENWVPCPKCGTMIERAGGCHHLTHERAAGCKTEDEATHFCALCGLILYGKYHKDEPDGTLHFPEGLFKACRVAAKLIKEGKMSPLPHVADESLPNGLGEGAQNNNPPDLGRSWSASLFCVCCEPSDGWTCVKGFCCPCYLGGEVEEMLPILGCGGKYCSCLQYCCCWPCVAPYRRYKIRKLFGLKGFCCIDCCVSNLCPCCSVIQERSELIRRAGPDVQVMA